MLFTFLGIEKRKNDLNALMNGYLEGDGNYDAPNDRWRLSFCRNDAIARDLRTLCARLGYHLTLKASDARLRASAKTA